MPGEIPVAMPDDEHIVATAVLPLVQVPPVVVLDNVNVDPTHIAPLPLIAPGGVFKTSCTGDVAAEEPLLEHNTIHLYHNVVDTVPV